MATRINKATKKPVKAVTASKNRKAVKTSPKKRETAADLKARIKELEEQRDQTLADYGKLLEVVTNIRFKRDAMLGQMLKGLFLIGIGPDELHAKCEQMFRKKVVAD